MVELVKIWCHYPLAKISGRQGHVSYAFGSRIWMGVTGTWFGAGETRVEGVLNPDEQRNTRLGGTLSIPLGRFQSMKIVYSTGTSTRRGTDFDSFSGTGSSRDIEAPMLPVLA